MEGFGGFSQEVVEILLDIRFNNNKEWYAANKARYNEYIHKPITELANEICLNIKNVHEDFNDIPKVCRIIRDTRYSKNKARYKDSKWFFLREGAISSIEYPRPNYFFEIKAECYVYGLGIWPEIAHMSLFRENALIKPQRLKEVIEAFHAQNIFSLTGDIYKKKYINDMEEPYKDWYIRKNFTFITERPIDDLLFSKSLVSTVTSDFLTLYPIYSYFSDIMRKVSISH